MDRVVCEERTEAEEILEQFKIRNEAQNQFYN